MKSSQMSPSVDASFEPRKFLTDEDVVVRYRGVITIGTLRNWRSQRTGPAYIKVGKAVLYPVSELDAWDQKQIIKQK